MEKEIFELKTELHIVKRQLNETEFELDKSRKTDTTALRQKLRDIHSKYLKAESLRKSLIYQKKYLLLMLGGYQETEEQTLRILASMGGSPDKRTLSSRYVSPLHKFKSAVSAVCAIWRLKFYVRHWRRACKIGGQALTTNPSNGYPIVSNRL